MCVLRRVAPGPYRPDAVLDASLPLRSVAISLLARIFTIYCAARAVLVVFSVFLRVLANFHSGAGFIADHPCLPANAAI